MTNPPAALASVIAEASIAEASIRFEDAIARILPAVEDQTVADEIRGKLGQLSGAIDAGDLKTARAVLREADDLLELRSHDIHPANLSAIRLAIKNALPAEDER